MFDLARFRRLIAATWLENRRAWAWFLAVGVIVHFLYCLAMLSTEEGWKAFSTQSQAMIWTFGLFLSAPIFAGRYFNAMARRESALVLMLRPASAFEKWLLAVLLVAVVYPVAYTLAFQICNGPAWLFALPMMVANSDVGCAAEGLATTRWDCSYFAPWWMLKAPQDWLVIIFGLLGTMQAFAMLGSLYFRSFPFIKTILAGFVIVLFLMLATALGGGEPSLFFDYWDGERELHSWQDVFFPAAWIGIPSLLWIGSLFALRERQVA
jgi:hypothetical protein